MLEYIFYQFVKRCFFDKLFFVNLFLFFYRFFRSQYFLKEKLFALLIKFFNSKEFEIFILLLILGENYISRYVVMR